MLFLLSDLARAITGEVLHVDGGFHAMGTALVPAGEAAGASPTPEPAGAERMRPPVFMTGATGFLGMEVLARLLEAGDREVVCLVRAADGRRRRGAPGRRARDAVDAIRRPTATASARSPAT